MRLSKVFVLAGFAAAVGWWLYSWQTGKIEERGAAAAVRIVAMHPYVTKQIEVRDGTTYGILMEEAGVGGSVAAVIFDTAAQVYDLSRIRLGRHLDLVYARDTHELRRVTYQIDSEEVLHVTRNSEEENGWEAIREEIAYEVRRTEASGTIGSSLYLSAMEQDLDERAIIALADVFQWTIDFAMDVRVGDNYTFIYEKRYLDGEYVMSGSVIAAKYVNDGMPHYAFRFEKEDGEYGYYDEEGESVQKVFLKAPVAYKYVSSGFTTGRRYVSAFNVSTGHRAIDYAAPTGTPIRSVGDGTVIFAGWDSGGYGYRTSIRHNGIYTTNYAHQSRIAVSYGQKVSQGQTIGYVGSTGFSTGPHLHYEMVKYGIKINPLREEFPSTDPISERDMGRYMQEMERLKAEVEAI